MNSKIKSLKELKKITKRLKFQGKKIVFTNGCFDILHRGHVEYLKSAKSLGDVLVVGLNTDASVRRLKGKNRPIYKQTDRAAVLAALEMVDYVVFFNQDTPLELIKIVKPNILVKGGDWHKDKIVGADFVKFRGGKVATIPFVKGFSTSSLIKKLKGTA